MASRKVGSWLVAVVVLALAVVTLLWVRYLRVPTKIAYVSEEEGGISVVDLNTLKVIRRVHPKDVAPRGLGVSFDGKYLITANKDTADVAVFSTPRLPLVTRMYVGDNPEFIKLGPAGDRFFATFEPGSEGGPPGADDVDDDANEPPAQIASFHIGDWAPGPVSTAGKETEGLEFSPDGRQLLVANEAQNDIGVFDAATGAHVRDIDLKPYGIRPRGVKVSPLENGLRGDDGSFRNASDDGCKFQGPQVRSDRGKARWRGLRPSGQAHLRFSGSGTQAPSVLGRLPPTSR
jgi:hypothetical protein